MTSESKFIDSDSDSDSDTEVFMVSDSDDSDCDGSEVVQKSPEEEEEANRSYEEHKKRWSDAMENVTEDALNKELEDEIASYVAADGEMESDESGEEDESDEEEDEIDTRCTAGAA